MSSTLKTAQESHCICEAMPAALAIPDDPTDRRCAKDCGILSYLKAYNNFTINTNNEGRWVFLLKNGAFRNCVPWLPKVQVPFSHDSLLAAGCCVPPNQGDVLCSAAAPADNPRKPGSISYPNLSLLQHVTKLQILPQEELVLRCLPQPSNTFAFLTASNEFIFN